MSTYMRIVILAGTLMALPIGAVAGDVLDATVLRRELAQVLARVEQLEAANTRLEAALATHRNPEKDQAFAHRIEDIELEVVSMRRQTQMIETVAGVSAGAALTLVAALALSPALAGQGQGEPSALEALGQRLFFDTALSEPAGQSCASCHAPPLFTDFTYDNLGVPRHPDNPFYRLPAKFNAAGEQFVDRGLGGALKQREQDGKFKVPTLRNVALRGPYMHNGYFATLAGVVDFYNDRDVRPLCASHRLSEAVAQARGCWPAPEVIVNVNRDELGQLGLDREAVADIVAFLGTLTDGWQGDAGTP
jgi:cytochrome c peroxidase